MVRSLRARQPSSVNQDCRKGSRMPGPLRKKARFIRVEGDSGLQKGRLLMERVQKQNGMPNGSNGMFRSYIQCKSGLCMPGPLRESRKSHFEFEVN